jgi:hypothetical protein
VDVPPINNERTSERQGQTLDDCKKMQAKSRKCSGKARGIEASGKYSVHCLDSLQPRNLAVYDAVGCVFMSKNRHKSGLRPGVCAAEAAERLARSL